MSIKFPVVPISTPVQYFAGGDIRQLASSARVVLDCGGGVLSLVIDEPGGGTSISKRNVRHASDDELTRNPESSRRFGCWDWNPLIKPEVSTFYEANEPVVPVIVVPNDKEVQEKVRKLHDEGLPPVEIAKKLRVKGWGADRIEDYLETLTA